jgi:long-chain acyl-CoA synthetase
VNFFAAAKIPVLQGYGLTEASPVVTVSRHQHNRPGSVGKPIAGIDVAIAEDGEILTRGPHVMRGYHEDEKATREAIDDEGWLHTGDFGRFDDDGFLFVTGRKKSLLKLSTGEYVMPQPLEDRLQRSPLIEKAIVVGDGEKYCAALLFVSEEGLGALARRHAPGAEARPAHVLSRPEVLERFERAVAQANQGLPEHSTIKRFLVVPQVPTIDNGLLTPTMKVRRGVARERYARDIDRMYASAEGERPGLVAQSATNGDGAR